jgi:chromosome segregation ATPase
VSPNEKLEILIQSKSQSRVQSLNRMASKLRDDRRQMTVLQELIASLKDELAQEKMQTEELSKTWKDQEQYYLIQLRSSQGKLDILTSSNAELDVLRSKLHDNEVEVINHKKTVESLREEMAQSSHASMQLKLQLLSAQSDIDDRNNRINSLQDQILRDREERELLLNELESRKIQVDTMSRNVDKVMQSLGLSESIITEERNLRRQFEQQLQELEAKVSHDSGTATSQMLLEKDALQSKYQTLLYQHELDVKTHDQYRLDAEETIGRWESKFVRMESKVSELTGFKVSLEESLQSATSDLEIERCCRIRLEASLESMQKTLADDRRRALTMTMSNRADLEAKLETSLTEISYLKSTVRELNQKLLIKQDEIQALESTLSELRNQLSHSQLNFEQLIAVKSDLADRADRLQSELQGKSLYIEKIEYWLRDLLAASKLDFSAEGPGSGAENDIIKRIIDSIRLGLITINEEVRSTRSLMSKTQAMQLEISNLRLKLSDNEHQLTTFRIETPTKSFPVKDSDEQKSSHLLNQVKLLQEALRLETTAKIGVTDENKQLKVLLERQTQDHKRMLQSKSSNDVHDLEDMRRDCARLQAQVKGLMANEQKLNAFVTEFDQSFLQRVHKMIDDALLTTMTNMGGGHVQNSIQSEIDTIRKSIRCKITDNLYLSLSRFVVENMTGESGRGSLSTKSFGKFSILCSDLMAEQVTSIVHGFEQEIHSLETLTFQLTRKWSDAQSYISELDRQVEDQMKQLYR